MILRGVGREAVNTASLYYKELTSEAIEYISIYVTKSNLNVPSSTFLKILSKTTGIILV